MSQEEFEERMRQHEKQIKWGGWAFVIVATLALIANVAALFQ